MAFRKAHMDAADDSNGAGLKDALFKRPAARVSWICAFLLLLYVGVEVSIGGWIVTLMRDVREAEPFPSGMTSMGFWLGITAGRMVLGFVTARLGERLATPVWFEFLSLVFGTCPDYDMLTMVRSTYSAPSSSPWYFGWCPISTPPQWPSQLKGSF